MFFSLESWQVVGILVAIIGGATFAGYATGHYLREHSEALREPFGVMQAALLGLVGLVMAFGLSLALGRYEVRRAATVAEANAIGTTYLRAELIAEPARSRSLTLLRSYTDLAIRVAHEVPNGPDMRATTAAEGGFNGSCGRSRARRSPPHRSRALRGSTSTVSTPRSTLRAHALLR